MHGKLLPLSAQQLQEIFDDFLGTQLAIMPNSVTPYALALARSSRLDVLFTKKKSCGSQLTINN